MRPGPNGERIEVAVLGRGQFVGERAVINDKLRSADCVAMGNVQVVVLKKRDFIDLDNPLLAWMLDYDAVSAVIKVCACMNVCSLSIAPIDMGVQSLMWVISGHLDAFCVHAQHSWLVSTCHGTGWLCLMPRPDSLGRVLQLLGL